MNNDSKQSDWSITPMMNEDESTHSEFPPIAEPSEYPPSSEGDTGLTSYHPPPLENTHLESVIDTLVKHAKNNLDAGMRMQALIEGYRQVIIRIFDLAEENKTLILENEKLKRDNYKKRRWIKGLVEQNNFLQPVDSCGEDIHRETSETGLGKNKEGESDNTSKLENLVSAFKEEERLWEQVKMEKANKENEQLRAELIQLKEEKNELSKEEIRLRNEVEKYRAPCGCDRRSFGRPKLIPNMGLAKDIYNDALVTTREKNEARNKKRGKILLVVKTLLKEAFKDYNRHHNIRQNRRNFRLFNEALVDQSQEITDELLSVKDIGVHQVAQILSHAYINPRERIGAGEIQEVKPAKFRELCTLLSAKKSTEPYFYEVRKITREGQKMNIPHVWREKEGEERADRSLMEYAARQANRYAVAFLGEHLMDSDILMTNSMRGLQAIITECMNRRDHLPVNEHNFKRLISATTKIRFMHLAETIKSQIDFKKNDKITSHLREKISAYTEYTKAGKPVLTLGPVSEGGIYERDDRDDRMSIVVESISVRNSKSDIAIARKFMVKDADGNNNYDPGKIHDFTGLRIELTERDSHTYVAEDEQGRTESPIQHATEKILSILGAIFGADLPKSRLRYSYDKGSVNEYSTGNHRAFQVTFRYRHQCVVNGDNGNGYPNMNSIPAEVQIVIKMDKKERDADHKDYEKKKDRTIQNVMGMDRSFTVWLSDLADAVLDEKELVCEAHDSLNMVRLTDREYIAKLLLIALTERRADGRLENTRAIEILLADEHQKRKLKKVARKFADYTPFARRNRMNKGLETANSKISLNRMAAEALEIIENYKKGSGTTK